jgi:hypothetical protein
MEVVLMTTKPIGILCLFALLLIASASAIPTTLPATAIGNNNFTLSATGCDSTGCWFEYGLVETSLIVWTPTNEPVGGVVTDTEFSAPIEPSMKYYATACDVTGCDATPISFTTLAFTPLPVSTLGAAVTNMTRSKFNLLYLPANLIAPYVWLFPQSEKAMAITIVFGMLLFFIYLGLWLRQRSVAGPALIGLLTASSLMFSNQGLHLGIPVEFQAIAQALLYASLAGLFLSLLKR